MEFGKVFKKNLKEKFPSELEEYDEDEYTLAEVKVGFEDTKETLLRAEN